MLTIRKRKLIGLIIFTCLLMVLLAASFPALQMRPGDIFPFQASEGEAFSSGSFTDGVGWFLVLTQGIIAGLILLLPVYILIGLLNKEERKKLLANVITILLILLIMIWPYKKDPTFTQSDELITPQPEFNMPDLELDTAALPTFQPNLEPWMLPLIMIGAAVLLAVVAYFLLKFLSNRDALDRSPYLDIAKKAQTALEEIEEAKIDFDDIIVRCYAQMSHTLQTEKGIQRDQAMTSSEFEQELLARGLPAQPIQQLTQLFEQVRYGHQHPMENEKQVAVKSLSEIIDFCRGKA